MDRMKKHGGSFSGRHTLLLRAALFLLCLCVILPVGFLTALSVFPVKQAGVFGGYADLFSASSLFWRFWRAYGNSLLICAFSLTGQLITGILGGWGLAKYRFPGRRMLLFTCFVFLLLPVQAVVLPQYLLLRSCELLDTLWALILPGMFSPLGTVLLWHGFSKVPNEIVEAAVSEGAGWLATLWRIVLPECKRELSALMLISVAESWSLLEQPMAYVKSPENYPLSIYLSTMAIAEPSQRAAACITTLSPIVVLFLLLWRRLFGTGAKGGFEGG